MFASFSSAYHSVKKVLSWEEGTHLVTQGTAANNPEMTHLGEAMLSARKNLSYSLAATVCSSTASFLSTHDGSCVSALVSLWAGIPASRGSIKECKEMGGCLFSLGPHICAIAAIDSLKLAAYTHCHNALALSADERAAQNPLQQTVLKLADLINHFVPGPVEYLGGPPIEARAQSTATASLRDAFLWTIIGGSLAFVSSQYYSECSTLFLDCLPTYLVLASMVRVITSSADILTTAGRVQAFFEVARTE